MNCVWKQYYHQLESARQFETGHLAKKTLKIIFSYIRKNLSMNVKWHVFLLLHKPNHETQESIEKILLNDKADGVISSMHDYLLVDLIEYVRAAPTILIKIWFM